MAPAIAAVAVAMPSSQDIAAGIQGAQRAQIQEQIRASGRLLNVNLEMLAVLSEQGTSSDIGRAVRDAVQSIT
jgi:hypothetical protein